MGFMKIWMFETLAWIFTLTLFILVWSRSVYIDNMFKGLKSPAPIEIFDWGLRLEGQSEALKRAVTGRQITYSRLFNGDGEVHGLIRFDQRLVPFQAEVQEGRLAKIFLNQFFESFSASFPPPDDFSLDLEKLFKTQIQTQPTLGCDAVKKQILSGRTVNLRKNFRNEARAVDIMARDISGDWLAMTLRHRGPWGWTAARLRCFSSRGEAIEYEGSVNPTLLDSD